MHPIDRFLLQHVPLSQAMGVYLHHQDADEIALAAPLVPNLNDKQTAFGGSLASLCSLCGWATIYLLLSERAYEQDADIAIAHADVRFLAPVRHELIARCPWPAVSVRQQFVADYEQQRKATLSLEIKVFGGDLTAVQFTGRYVAWPKAPVLS